MHLHSIYLAASLLSLGLCTPTGTTLQPQFHVRAAAASGPCPMTRYNSEPCRDMLDSSACWNGIIGPNGGGNADRAEQLWNCVPGGKEYMCQCYGCDSGLDAYFTRHKLCEAPTP